MNTIHLILDLDGTLINENGEPRPNVTTFLDFCFKNCASVNIWTAASLEWYNEIRFLRNYPFKFIWTGDRCTTRSIGYQGMDSIRIKIKRLKKVWKVYRNWQNPPTKYNTLIIDDTPLTYRDNWGNAMRITTYINGHDEELSKIIEWFNNLLAEVNVRSKCKLLP